MKQIQELSKKLDKYKEKCDECEKKCEEYKSQCDEYKNQCEILKVSNIEISNKIINSNLEKKMEVLELKKEIRKINYRDISKIIIDDYINKFNSTLNKLNLRSIYW